MGEKYWGHMNEDEKALLVGKLVSAKNLKERAEVLQSEFSKIPIGGSTKDFNEAEDLADKLQGYNAYDPSLPRVLKELHEALAKPVKKPPVARPITPTVVMQAGSGGVQRQGLHTPTMAEIIAKANQRDPTAPYFDTNSDHMRQIDPLAPHYDLSGDFPKLVTPLKPGPKISNLG